MSLRGVHAAAHRCGRQHDGLSRRDALKWGGATAAGVAAWGLFGSSIASADPGGDANSGQGSNGLRLPQQVEGYSPVLASLFGGLQIPFFLPVEIDPFAGLPVGGPFDPSTIGEFNGFVTVVEADGVTANNSEGVERRWAADVRIIEGTYIDRDGRTRNGAFTFL